jgi:hypothetical protein
LRTRSAGERRRRDARRLNARASGARRRHVRRLLGRGATLTSPALRGLSYQEAVGRLGQEDQTDRRTRRAATRAAQSSHRNVEPVMPRANQCFCGRGAEGSGQLASNLLGWEMNEQISELMQHAILFDALHPIETPTNPGAFPQRRPQLLADTAQREPWRVPPWGEQEGRQEVGQVLEVDVEEEPWSGNDGGPRSPGLLSCRGRRLVARGDQAGLGGRG